MLGRKKEPEHEQSLREQRQVKSTGLEMGLSQVQTHQECQLVASIRGQKGSTHEASGRAVV